jgi:hypothetical protein
MSAALTIGLAAVLSALAALHIAWALGLNWPAPKGEKLAFYVTTGARRPGRVITFAVASAIIAGAAVILAFRARLSEPWGAFANVGYVGLAGVFLLRGAAGYVPAFWQAAQGRPFHRLNRLYYSPLCLLIGGGLVLNATLH